LSPIEAPSAESYVNQLDRVHDENVNRGNPFNDISNPFRPAIAIPSQITAGLNSVVDR
jgi:hypothetical protein